MLNVIALIFIYGGFITTFYGISLNRNWEVQLRSLIFGGFTNPGTIWIVIGIPCIILGTVIILAKTFKKPKKKY